MFDKELALEILDQIYNTIQRIQTRFEPIGSVDDFTSSEAGVEKLDAICMQLIAVGESLKHLDRLTENDLLPKCPGINWKKIKGMRDIISHHSPSPACPVWKHGKEWRQASEVEA